jgi:hypothetical protein
MGYKNPLMFIKRILKRDIPNGHFVISADQDRILRNLIKDVDRYVAKNHLIPKARVLFIPSYYMISYTRLFDIFMVLALRLRGVEIIPVLSDSLFCQQFFFGGIYESAWNGSSYTKMESKIWKEMLNTKPLEIFDFYHENDIILADEISKQVTFENYRQLTYKGYPVGKKASDITANQNNLPGMINRSDVLDQLRLHVGNIVRLIIAYERVFKAVNVDAVFSNVPFYYKWHIPYYFADRRNMPFYSAMLGERKNTFLFSCNTDTMLDATPAWSSFKMKRMSKETQTNLEDLINARAYGKTDAYSPYPLPEQNTVDHHSLSSWLNKDKPLVIFPVNVLYDATVYQASSLVDNPLEFIEKIIAFFELHPEYQLIIKAHPAESLAYASGSDLFTRFCMRYVLASMRGKITKNILFLDYDSKIPMSDLIPMAKLGIVYTSSTAMEMAWAGKPVISVAQCHYSGKGFTYEPKNIEELYALVTQILLKGETTSVINKRIELSKKYYWLYYHARIDFKLFQGSDTGNIPTKLLFKNYKDLLPGKNAALDYVCDSIIKRVPIYGNNRWPPATV